MNEEKALGADAAAGVNAGQGSETPAIARHTEGPWKMRVTGCDTPSGSALGTITYIEGRAVEIAVMYDDTDQIANAHLIAAAPDLLVVAQNIVAICDSGNQNLAELACMETSPLVGLARAALAKAEGRS